MTYWRLHYHLIWATFERRPILTAERERVFYGVLYGKAKELDLKVHTAGNVDDHVHIVLSIPPKLSVADCVRHLKGASAYAINHMPNSDGQFKWQEGCGEGLRHSSLTLTAPQDRNGLGTYGYHRSPDRGYLFAGSSGHAEPSASGSWRGTPARSRPRPEGIRCRMG